MLFGLEGKPMHTAHLLYKPKWFNWLLLLIPYDLRQTCENIHIKMCQILKINTPTYEFLKEKFCNLFLRGCPR